LQQLAGHWFQSESEEINFFKECKPKFTAEREYYNLLYHSFLFLPPDPADALLFWKREEARLERFVAENNDFYNYHRNNQTDLDAFYFLRSQYNPHFHTKLKLYAGMENAVTNGDVLLSMLMALERYESYAAEKVRLLKNE
jgi:hypothetical protein